jgi:hypothetical protein
MAPMPAPAMMNVSIGAALMIGAILPPAMMYPPNTHPNSTTSPMIANMHFSGQNDGNTSPSVPRAQFPCPMWTGPGGNARKPTPRPGRRSRSAH